MKNQSFLIRFAYAVNGIRTAVQGEASFRIQLSLSLMVLIALALMRATPLWWALIFLCIGVVLTAEMFNTALEHLIDHLHPERHTAIGIVKDCAAGAVLISSLSSVAIFAAFLIDRFA